MGSVQEVALGIITGGTGTAALFGIARVITALGGLSGVATVIVAIRTPPSQLRVQHTFHHTLGNAPDKASLARAVRPTLEK